MILAIYYYVINELLLSNINILNCNYVASEDNLEKLPGHGLRWPPLPIMRVSMPLEKLIKGFRKFRSSYFVKNDRYTDLVKGQSPEALVIACSDSRNDPALLTRSEPGDIFVVRNVAAVVPPYQPDDNYHGTSAAIEFAVKGLKVKNIMVLGHALCGGVRALAEQSESKTDFEFLSHWIKIGAPAQEIVNQILTDMPQSVKIKALEQAVILTSLNNLMTFPWIRQGVTSGKIILHGWYFDMVDGKMLAYDFASGQFREMNETAEGFTKAPKGCCAPWPIEQMVRHHLTSSKHAA